MAKRTIDISKDVNDKIRMFKIKLGLQNISEVISFAINQLDMNTK